MQGIPRVRPGIGSRESGILRSRGPTGYDNRGSVGKEGGERRREKGDWAAKWLR